MAVKFAIRNYSRSGNVVTFTVIAVNADGTIDTGYVGGVSFTPNNISDPGAYTFVAADMGQRTFSATIANPAARGGLTALFPAGGGTSLSVAPPTGTNNFFVLQGDHLLVGGSGADTYGGNDGNDLFLFQDGGNDRGVGGAGDDGFYFGGAYTNLDSVEGGSGSRDQLALQGDYSGGVTLGQVTDVEFLVLLAGNDARFGDTVGNVYDYNIIVPDSVVAAGQTFVVQANALRTGEDLVFNGSAETNGSFLIYSGQGNDTLTGGAGNDGFFFGQGRFNASDIVTGGAGTVDQLGLQGNFAGGNAISFGAGQLIGLEYIVLLSASETRFGAAGGTAAYDLTMNNGNVGAGQTMIISANTLLAGETLIFRGGNETDGSFRIFSGAGNDIINGSRNADEIWGGAGSDRILGLAGADILRGGAGADIFDFVSANDSTAAASDQIRDFALGDTISLASVAFTAGGNFTFIGGAAQSGARQLQVIQNGNVATVNIFIDGNNTADMVLNLTVVDGHTITSSDFTAVDQAPAAEPLTLVDAPIVMDSAVPDKLSVEAVAAFRTTDARDWHDTAALLPSLLDRAMAADFGGLDAGAGSLYKFGELEMLGSHDPVM